MTISRKAKEAIKTALAMTIAHGIALSLDWDRTMWAGFAVAAISLATVGQSLNKGAMRMFLGVSGTILFYALVSLQKLSALIWLRGAHSNYKIYRITN
jgi:uncharacterized membrane protein YccC